MDVVLPSEPPFALRARVLSPLQAGGTLHLEDGLVQVDAAGRITRVTDAAAAPSGSDVIDLRPLVVMPGMVDLHVHLPQIPNAGLGAGMDLLAWLQRYIFPLERDFDHATADAVVPSALRAFASVGTTTIVAYAALWPDSTDACFAAAQAHGIRAVIGKVMMDRITYDEHILPQDILKVSLAESEALCERWHGADGGRLAYAFTPRFAVSCTADLLRASAQLAEAHGAYWQTHLSEDNGEVDEVRRLFPDARDYLDVYEHAGALPRLSILAHAIHLSDDEVARLAASGAGVAHCPASNLFLSSGMMPAARYVNEGIPVGLGSDMAAGPDMSIFGVMQAASVTQRVLQLSGRLQASRPLGVLDWLRMATLGGAEVLGIADRMGSLEVGKEADLIVVDPRRTAPLEDAPTPADPEDLVSRLVFRTHPQMVQGAWVRGRLLPA